MYMYVAKLYVYCIEHHPRMSLKLIFIFQAFEYILANHPDFIRTVLIFDLQNLQKSGRPDFPEFQPVTILVFKIYVLISDFQMLASM